MEVDRPPVLYFTKLAVTTVSFVGAFTTPEEYKTFFLSSGLFGLASLAMDRRLRLGFKSAKADMDEDNSRIYKNANE